VKGLILLKHCKNINVTPCFVVCFLEESVNEWIFQGPDISVEKYKWFFSHVESNLNFHNGSALTQAIFRKVGFSSA